MYSIITLVYGVVPTKEQREAILNHYGEDWPDHLGESPYSGDTNDTEYIGVPLPPNLQMVDLWELHGKTVASQIPTEIPEAIRLDGQLRCATIRKEVPGCEDFPEPLLIFTYSTS